MSDWYDDLQYKGLFFKGCSRKNGIRGMKLKLIKLLWVGGVSWNIHMDCTIKKIKLCWWYPHFKVLFHPQHLFSWNSPKWWSMYVITVSPHRQIYHWYGLVHSVADIGCWQLHITIEGNGCDRLFKPLFSSPEHEVLKWAFVILQCPASVVRPSVRACVRQQFL